MRLPVGRSIMAVRSLTSSQIARLLSAGQLQISHRCSISQELPRTLLELKSTLVGTVSRNASLHLWTMAFCSAPASYLAWLSLGAPLLLRSWILRSEQDSWTEHIFLVFSIHGFYDQNFDYLASGRSRR